MSGRNSSRRDAVEAALDHMYNRVGTALAQGELIPAGELLEMLVEARVRPHLAWNFLQPQIDLATQRGDRVWVDTFNRRAIMVLRETFTPIHLSGSSSAENRRAPSASAGSRPSDGQSERSAQPPPNSAASRPSLQTTRSQSGSASSTKRKRTSSSRPSDERTQRSAQQPPDSAASRPSLQPSQPPAGSTSSTRTQRTPSPETSGRVSSPSQPPQGPPVTFASVDIRYQQPSDSNGPTSSQPTRATGDRQSCVYEECDRRVGNLVEHTVEQHMPLFMDSRRHDVGDSLTRSRRRARALEMLADALNLQNVEQLLRFANDTLVRNRLVWDTTITSAVDRALRGICRHARLPLPSSFKVYPQIISMVVLHFYPVLELLLRNLSRYQLFCYIERLWQLAERKPGQATSSGQPKRQGGSGSSGKPAKAPRMSDGRQQGSGRGENSRQGTQWSADTGSTRSGTPSTAVSSASTTRAPSVLTKQTTAAISATASLDTTTTVASSASWSPTAPSTAAHSASTSAAALYATAPSVLDTHLPDDDDISSRGDSILESPEALNAATLQSDDEAMDDGSQERGDEPFDAHFHLDRASRKFDLGPPWNLEDFLSRPVSPKHPIRLVGSCASYCDPEHFHQIVVPDPKTGHLTCVGVHPTKITTDNVDQLHAQLMAIIQDPKIVALGEIGLDFLHVSDEKRRAQIQFPDRVPESWSDPAISLNRPVVIHIRSGNQHSMGVTQWCAPNTVRQKLNLQLGDSAKFMLHCYQDAASVTNGWLRAFPNAYFSICGAKKHLSPAVLESLRLIPSDRLLVETDSPYNACHPTKYPWSHPQTVGDVAELVAAGRPESRGQILKLTVRNALAFYRP